MCLRRPFYEHYYYQHCQNATHANARNLWDRAKKNKTDNKPSLNQTMLHNYFSKAIKKPKKKNDNNEKNNDNKTSENLDRGNETPVDKQPILSRHVLLFNSCIFNYCTHSFHMLVLV